MSDIDWKKVNEKLRCPICGDKAHIEPESDGTRGSHVHYFDISREWARKLSQPSAEEIKSRIKELQTELNTLQAQHRTLTKTSTHFTSKRTHLPSGHESISTWPIAETIHAHNQSFPSIKTVDDLIAHWNRLGGVTWHYERVE